MKWMATFFSTARNRELFHSGGATRGGWPEDILYKSDSPTSWHGKLTLASTRSSSLATKSGSSRPQAVPHKAGPLIGNANSDNLCGIPGSDAVAERDPLVSHGRHTRRRSQLRAERFPRWAHTGDGEVLVGIAQIVAAVECVFEALVVLRVTGAGIADA